MLMEETATIDTATTYYLQNKKAIVAKKKRAVQCSKCKKLIQYASLNYHKKSKLCNRVYMCLMAQGDGDVEVVNVI